MEISLRKMGMALGFSFLSTIWDYLCIFYLIHDIPQQGPDALKIIARFCDQLILWF